MYKIASRYFFYTLGLIGLRKAIKSKEDSIEVPSFRGIVEVKHKMKGRIRFRIPVLKSNEKGFKQLEDQMNQIDNISVVETNSVTGSLLVKYTEAIEPTLIVGIIIKLLGLEDEVKKPRQAVITSEFRKARDSVNYAINEKTLGILDLKSILFVLFTTFGIRKILKNPALGPNGYTFLWWGSSMLK